MDAFYTFYQKGICCKRKTNPNDLLSLLPNDAVNGDANYHEDKGNQEEDDR